MFKRPKKNTAELQQLSALFEVALGESPSRAHELAVAWVLYRKVSARYWREAADISLRESMQRADSISMQDKSLLQHFLRSHCEGIVLLTIHMGDYLHSLLKILALVERRTIVILRRKGWSQDEQNAFGKLHLIGHDVDIIRHGPAASRSIAKALRAGSIAILLYDLPKRWGKTYPVRVFNHRMHWAMGPLQLAMMGKASVVPFYTFNTTQGCVCELEPVRDYRQVGGDKSSLLHTEMQFMAATAEKYIKNNIIQWDHWGLVPEMVFGEKND